MITRRHPMRAEQIAATLNARGRFAVDPALEALVASGQLRRLDYRGCAYYVPGRRP